MRFDVVPHDMCLQVLGSTKKVSMSLTCIPRVNELTGSGNMVGPTYPEASGSSLIAARYEYSMSGRITTSSSMNRTYCPVPASQSYVS